VYVVYTEVLCNFTAVSKESAAKEVTAKITITKLPSNMEFCKQRIPKWKPSNNTNKRTKKPATSALGVSDPQLLSKD
jgi:hypothetical protein